MKRLFVVLILCAVTGIGIWYGWSWYSQSEPLPLPEKPLPEEEVTLYFLDTQTASLTVLRRNVPEAKTNSDRVRQIITELGTDPADTGVISILPEELELRSAFLDGEIVYLDFNQAIMGAAQGSTEEMLFLYSIVNSVLANLPEKYKLVHFLVEGEMKKTIGAYGEESGHIAIQYPLGPRWNLTDTS